MKNNYPPASSCITPLLVTLHEQRCEESEVAERFLLSFVFMASREIVKKALSFALTK